MNTRSLRLLLVLFFVMILSVWPMSGWFAKISPPWILLFVIYVQIFSPRLFRLTWVFLLGLYCDVLFFSVMGEHVIALLLTCWIMSSTSKRFVFLSILQQLLWVMVCCLTYQLVIYFIDAFMGNWQPLWWSLCSAILGMLLWPWFRLCIESEVIVPVK